MTHNFKNFPSIENMDDLAAAHFIDTAVKKIDDFKPSMTFIERIGDYSESLRVLDFGCGLGRNCVGMLDYSRKWIVWGYDHQKMIERGKKFYGNKLVENDRLFLTDDWNMIIDYAANSRKKGKFFDAIFTSLVLQHIDLDELRKYLDDFTRMTDMLCVVSRRASDVNWTKSSFVSVWNVISEKFDGIELDKGLIEGNDPNDHHFGIFQPAKE